MNSLVHGVACPRVRVTCDVSASLRRFRVRSRLPVRHSTNRKCLQTFPLSFPLFPFSPFSFSLNFSFHSLSLFLSSSFSFFFISSQLNSAVYEDRLFATSENRSTSSSLATSSRLPVAICHLPFASSR